MTMEAHLRQPRDLQSFLDNLDGHPVCALVKSFVARQGILAVAGLIFLGWIAVRVRLGKEKRDLKTFVSDVSKQAGQQMMGGTMLVLMGLKLSERGLSPLAWYGAQYPFEIVITTIFTGLFRQWVESGAVAMRVRTGWAWLEPYGAVGQYGPRSGEWRWSWYLPQLVQAIVLIGFPARVIAIGSIYLSLSFLPEELSPVHLLGEAWYAGGLSCNQQTVAILYVLPLLGDAVQFIIIDRLQAFGFLAPPQDSQSDSEEGGIPMARQERVGRSLLPSSRARSDSKWRPFKRPDRAS